MEAQKIFLIQIKTLLTKTAAAQNEVAFGYHRVRRLFVIAVVFAAPIITCIC